MDTQFGADQVADFPDGSIGAMQFTEISAVVNRLQREVFIGVKEH